MQVWPYVFTKQLRVEKGYATALFGKCMNSNCANNPYAPGLNMYTMCAHFPHQAAGAKECSADERQAAKLSKLLDWAV